MTETALRCYVEGQVQGVFFRASTQRQAQSLGLRGYARNLPDGRVEVLAIGPEEAIRSLEAWLWDGPPSAEVTDVTCEPAEAEEMRGFETR